MIEKIIEKAKSLNRPVYVFAHNFPDKDAIASSASLITYLDKEGISAKYVVTKPIRYSVSIGNIPLTRSVSNGIAVILDTNSVDYSENTLFRGFSPENTFVIDHHSASKSGLIEQELGIPKENVLRDPNAGSTCEMLLNDFDEKNISSDLATKLAVGLVSDSGRLSYITPNTLGNLEKLIKLGADYDKIVQENTSKTRLGLEVGLASTFLGAKKFKIGDSYGLFLALDNEQVQSLRDNYGITNPQKTIYKMADLTHCAFTCVVAENLPGIYNAEFRSFPFFENLDVFKLAQKFNGGGHPHASGANFYSKDGVTFDSLEKTIQADVPALPKSDTKVKTKFSSVDVDLKTLISDTKKLTTGVTPEVLDKVQSLIDQGASYDFSVLNFRTYEQFMLRNEILSRVPEKSLRETSPSISISLSQSEYDELISKYLVESFDILDSIHAFDGVNIESATLILPTGQVAQIDNNGNVRSYFLGEKEAKPISPNFSDSPDEPEM